MDLKFKNLLVSLITLGTFIFIGYFIPQTLALANQEINNPEIVGSLNLFTNLLTAGVIGCLILLGLLAFWKQNDKYTNSFGLANKGEVVPYFKKFSYIQLTLYSIIFFGWLFFVVNYFGNIGAFTDFRVLPSQQFSKADSLAFSSLLVPFAEEAMNLLFMGAFVFLLIILAVKYNWPKQRFMLYYFLFIPLTIGLLAVIWHNTAYEASQISLLKVGIFWALKALIILSTGFVIVGVIMHLLNNFFIEYLRLFTSDSLLGVVGGSLIALTILTVIIYRKRLFGGRPKNE